MDLDRLDPDFFVRSGCYTATYYRDSQPYIDLKSSKFSQTEKVIIVTGAGSGIGAEAFAPAFAQAGCRAIVLVGRTEHKLARTASILRKDYPTIEVLQVIADVANEVDVKQLFDSVHHKFGRADVLINNAGTLVGTGTIESSVPSEWWQNFTTNIKGTYVVSRAFLDATNDKTGGVIINLTSSVATQLVPGLSGYGISKMAIDRFTEYLAMEAPHVVSVSLDPGAVQTEMMLPAFKKFALDTPTLVGSFAVWLATEDAAFLTGRTINATWSIADLMKRENEIKTSNDLKFSMNGKFGLTS